MLNISISLMTLTSVSRECLFDVPEDIQIFHVGKREGSSEKGKTCESIDILPNAQWLV